MTFVELIRCKVRRTVIMGGGFPDTAKPETNIRLVKIKGREDRLETIIGELMAR